MNEVDICLLTQKMQVLYARFLQEMDRACLRFRITSVARDYKTQMALYVQGREDLHIVNSYRMAAGLSPLIKISENVVVTWTLNSKHVIRLDDQNPMNDYSSAFDIVLYNSKGRAHYDVKVNANNTGGADYDEAGHIGGSVGLCWGGRFRKPDRCHFQEPD